MNRFLPTKKNRRRNNLDKRITSMLRTLVETKENMIRAGEAKDDDLLGLLLQSNAQSNLQHSENNSKNYHMSMEEIIEECKQFYIAGHETTATWLTWTMIVLAMHQDWQEKAREEVLQVCGNKNPDPEAISHLKTVSPALFSIIYINNKRVILLST